MLVGAWRSAAGMGVSWGVSYCAIKAVCVMFRLVLIKALAVAHLRSRCLCLKYIPWFMGRRGHCEAWGFMCLLQIDMALRSAWYSIPALLLKGEKRLEKLIAFERYQIYKKWRSRQ